MSLLVTKEVDSNKQLCDAFGCEEIGTETIVVSAGEYGSIELCVCRNCISKFKETET